MEIASYILIIFYGIVGILGALIILFSYCWLFYKMVDYVVKGDSERALYCVLFLSLMIAATLSKVGD